MVEKKKKIQAKKGRLFSKRVIVKLIVIVGLMLFVASAVAWCVLVRNKPENVFTGVLENNLRTTSVTRTVKQDAGYQQLEQVMRIQNGSQHVTRGFTKLTQGGGSTVIVTESIGYPLVEYIRYNSITTTQKGTNGQPLDFSKILNVWAKNESADEDQLGSLYQDVTLGNLFLFADFDQATRNGMLKLIQENGVYDVDYSKVKKSWESGRQKYTYKISLNPGAYIAMIKQYGSEIGLTQLESLDPDAYKNADPVKFEIMVDVMSRRLDGVKSLNGATDQTFNGYGIIENLEVPKDAISSDELQRLLSESASV